MAARTNHGRSTALAPAPTKVPTIYCVRHGSTASNGGSQDVERFRGWLDLELSDRGIGEAGRAAKELSAIPLSDIYTSDLKRATVTAELIALFNAGHPPIEKTMGLRTWNVGEFSGLPERPNRAKLMAYVDTPKKVVPGGEAFDDFTERFFASFLTILREAQDEEAWESCAVVLHNSGLALIDAWIDAGASESNPTYDRQGFQADQEIVGPGGLACLEYRQDRWRWYD